MIYLGEDERDVEVRRGNYGFDSRKTILRLSGVRCRPQWPMDDASTHSFAKNATEWGTREGT